MSRRLGNRARAVLVRELDAIKRRLRTHGVEVAYYRGARSLSEHIADTKRRDEIERILIAGRTP